MRSRSSLSWLIAALMARLSLAARLCSQYRDLSDDIGHVLSVLETGTRCDAASGLLHYSWQVAPNTDLYRQIDVYCYNHNHSGSWVIVQPRTSNTSAGSAVYSVPPHMLTEDSQAACVVRGCYLISGHLTEYLTNSVAVNCSLPDIAAITTYSSGSVSSTSPPVTVTPTSTQSQQIVQVTHSLVPLLTHSRMMTSSETVPVPTGGRPVGQAGSADMSLAELLLISLPVITVVLIVIAIVIATYIVCYTSHRNHGDSISAYIFNTKNIMNSVVPFDSSLEPPLQPFTREMKTPYHSQQVLSREDNNEKNSRDGAEILQNVVTITDSPSPGCESCSSEHEVELHIDCKTLSNDNNDMTTCDDDTLQKSVFSLNSGQYGVQSPIEDTVSNKDDSDSTTVVGGVPYQIEERAGEGDDIECGVGVGDRTDEVAGHFQFYELPTLSSGTQPCHYQTSSSGYVTDTSSSVASPFSPCIAFEYLQTEHPICQQRQSADAEMSRDALPHTLLGGQSVEKILNYPNKFSIDQRPLPEEIIKSSANTPNELYGVCNILFDTEYDCHTSQVEGDLGSSRVIDSMTETGTTFSKKEEIMPHSKMGVDCSSMDYIHNHCSND